MTNPRALLPLIRIQLEARSRTRWETRINLVDDMQNQMTWLYEHLANAIGFPLDEELDVVSLSGDGPEEEAARTQYGVNPSAATLDLAIKNALGVLRLCFDLSLLIDQATNEFVQAEAALRGMAERGE